MKIEVGSIVRLKNGTSPIKITEIWSPHGNPGYLMAKYCYCSGLNHRDRVDKSRPLSDFVLLQQEIEDMSTLFKTNDHRYGTQIAINSKGEYVLEMKGEGGKVEAFDPKSLEEVLPYSVQIARLDDPGIQDHIQAQEGQLAEDDLLLDGHGDFWVVKKLDAKVKKPKAMGRFFRVNAERMDK